jgi:hypothetical protein
MHSFRGEMLLAGHATLQTRADLVNLAIREFLAAPDSGSPAH